MKKTTPVEMPSSVYSLILVISVVYLALFTTARWACLLAVLEPQKWLVAANTARWVWLIILFFQTLIGLIGQVALRIMPSPRPRRFFNVGMFDLPLSVGTIIALRMGRFDLALVISYLYTSGGSLRKLCFAPAEPWEHLPRQRLSRVIQSLYFPLLLATLALHSVDMAIILFSVEFVSHLVQIPLMQEQVRLMKDKDRQSNRN